MHITLHDKSLEVRLTAAAQKALARRETPLVAEMELLFSCLLRKRVLLRGGGRAVDAGQRTPGGALQAHHDAPLQRGGRRRCPALRAFPARESASLCAQLAGHRFPSRASGWAISATPTEASLIQAE